MKHLYAGLIVGGIAAVAVAVTLGLWWWFSLIIGQMASAMLVGILALLVVITAVIDKLSER